MKLNHVLILSKDLNKMSHFFKNVIGLDSHKRPPFPFRGAWFGSEGIAMIHVAEDTNKNNDLGSVHHFAIEGGHYQTLISTLKQEQIQYTERDVPLSGERQVFVNGPDGVIVEMMFPLGESDDKNHPYSSLLIKEKETILI